jgi:hypothetical protein
MNAKQVKIFLINKQLTVADMARQLRTATQSDEALRIMLSQMIHGRRFYPTLAKRVEKRYGLRLERKDGSRAKKAA